MDPVHVCGSGYRYMAPVKYKWIRVQVYGSGYNVRICILKWVHVNGSEYKEMYPNTRIWIWVQVNRSGYMYMDPGTGKWLRFIINGSGYRYMEPGTCIVY